MNRKIVALLLAIMLVASSVSAMAELVTLDGKTYLTDADVAKLAAFKPEKFPTKYEPTGKYEISADGIWAINNVLEFSLDTKIIESKKDYNTMTDAEALALKEANGSYKVVDQVVKQLNYQTVQVAEGFDHTNCVYCFSDEKHLIKNGDNYTVVTITGDMIPNTNNSVNGENVVKTGPDSFYLYYSNYDTIDTELVESVAFAPKAFGNGLVFDHSAAKSLFTIKVKYDAVAYIQIRDAQGRLYAVAGGTWTPAKNAYKVELAKGDNTISWYGVDGAGWHLAGSLNNPQYIELDVNMDVASKATLIDGKTPWYTDRVDIRFDYIVEHSVDNHTAADATASAPKTGDAGMAYMTLVALIVMAGAAVVVTRKVRNF